MSHPHNGGIPLPEEFGQSQTVFYNAKDRSALVVSTVNGLRESAPMDVIGPHGALEWCQAEGAHFVYVSEKAHN